jgi:hypothetical protein
LASAHCGFADQAWKRAYKCPEGAIGNQMQASLAAQETSHRWLQTEHH